MKRASHLWPHLTPIRPDGTEHLLRLVRGKGCLVYDDADNEYLDALAGNFCVQVGYGRRELAQAAARQLEDLAFCRNVAMAAPATIELADHLAEISGMARVFLSSGGSEAVETAMKLVRQFHRLNGEPQRTKIISRQNAYHGATLGALALNGVTSLRTPFEPLLPGVRHVSPGSLARGFRTEDLGSPGGLLETIEFEDPSTIGAIIVEPVQVTSGPILPEPGHYQRIREICDQFGILLISDEVVNAFGRLGSMFAYQMYGFTPDLVTLAKGMTSGYMPAGATLAGDRIASVFEESDDFFRHILTYGGHPASCAVALENLAIIVREELLSRSSELGSKLISMLTTLSDISIVGAIRGQGLLVGIELLADREHQTPLPPDLSKKVHDDLLDNGLIVRVDTRHETVIQIAPPLICEESHLERIADVLTRVLNSAQEAVERDKVRTT